MITKRIILVLLVALMSVTGVWAQNSGTDGETNWVYDAGTKTLTFSSQNSEPADMVNHKTTESSSSDLSLRPWKDHISEVESVKFIKIKYIGQNALCGATKLRSVDIPNTVTSIGMGAFSGCPLLASVTLPNSITGIGIGAFAGCESLTSIIIPDGVTVLSGTFEGCKSLKSIILPASITTINSSAFDNCTDLNSIIIDAVKAPAVDESSFAGVNKGNIDVLVPNSKAAVDYNDKWEGFRIVIDSFPPQGPGMRMKVTRKNGKVYEFKTEDLQSVEFYRVNE